MILWHSWVKWNVVTCPFSNICKTTPLLQSKKNRAILKSVLKAIIFSGTQNIGLRGSCEAISLVSSSQFAINPSSFQALLRFQIESGDEVVKDHFSAGQKNAQYRFLKIQNDLIAAVGKWIQKKLTQEMKATKFFTVYAAEGTDVANKEQLPLIIRFVDQSGMSREEFLEFVLCDNSTSGQEIADKIKFTLEKLTLDLNDLRGQG